MNIKHSVNAPAYSGKRSMLRGFVTAATAAAALTLGIAAQADDAEKFDGRFTLSTIAGMGDKYTGTLAVKGSGRFEVKDDGTNLIFVSRVGQKDKSKPEPKPILQMEDGRQEHTVGAEDGKSKLGIRWTGANSRVTVTIDKSKLKFPEAGKEVKDSVPAKVSFLGKDSTVKVDYTVKEAGGKYQIKNASFDFDYTKHVADGKKVCLVVVCVKPIVNISVGGATIDVKK